MSTDPKGPGSEPGSAPDPTPRAPGRPEPTGVDRPAGWTPKPGPPEHRPFPAGTPQPVRSSYSGAPGSPATGQPRPKRSAEEIRANIEEQRAQLGTSVEELRGRVNEITDWKLQLRKHKRELVIGAAVVGFALGGMAALRRRRR